MNTTLKSLKAYLIATRKLQDVDMMFDLDWNGWTVSCIHSNEEGERMLWNILDSRVHSSEMGDPVLLDFWNVFDAKVNS